MQQPSPWQKKITPLDITEICDLAQKAWDSAGPRTKTVRFKWRNIALVSHLTAFRILVDDPQGRPVCCRYH